MSQINVDRVKNRAGTGSPTFTNGIVVSGVGTFSSQVSIAGTLTYEDVTNVDSVGVITAREGIRIGAGKSIGSDGAAVVYYGDGSNLTNVGVDTSTVDASTLQVSGISTFKSDVRVTGNLNAGITTTSSLVNATPLSHRNLIINGAMRIAQRASSSTANGYGDLDRWKHEYAGTDANPTFSQVPVVSSDSGDNPYAVGLTTCARITNADQSSDLQASSLINFNQQIEAQYIRNSGWNYNSSSSYITLSYYVKASVTQEYHGFVKTQNGTNYAYPFSLGTLTANTWTRIIKTIPGNSNLQIDASTVGGFQVFPVFFAGTNYTNDSITEDAWAAWASGNRSHDQTATWYNTNGATFEITGVQLEVGPVATPFEHRSYQDEYLRCSRYFYFANNQHFFIGRGNGSSGVVTFLETQVPLRGSPSVTLTGDLRHYGIDSYSDSSTTPTVPSFRVNQKGIRLNQSGHSGVNDDCVLTMQVSGSDGQGIFLDAEI